MLALKRAVVPRRSGTLSNAQRKSWHVSILVPRFASVHEQDLERSFGRGTRGPGTGDGILNLEKG